MGTRWFGTLRAANHAVRSSEESALSDEPKAVLLHDAISSWRTWLTSGARQVPIDSRRARGADAQLKKTLMGGPSGAVDFSSAMARQAIDEAMNELPTQHKQVVKLAYLGGLTNRQIAQQLGLTVGGVRRRLRESLAIVSAYVERGRAMGRRAVHGLVIWLSWRRYGDGVQRLHGPAVDQVLQVGIVAVMTVAAALLVTHQAPAGPVAHPHKARVAAVGPAPSHLTHAQRTTTATAVNPAAPVTVADALPSATEVAPLPVNLQAPVLPVSVPALPVPPVVSGLARHKPVL
jgi:DNA-directed RNA polymerase specialized sigma24 family protein